MALEGTQSKVLKQFGVSYPRLVDYYSTQQAATLVSPAIPCGVFIQVDVGSSLHLGTSNMGLYYHVVRTLSTIRPNIVDTTHYRDSEIAFFWQAKRQLRWSVARILFMLVSFCTCSLYSCSISSLQNRYFPIVAFSLHVYWRINRSIDNPVRAKLPKYHVLIPWSVVGQTVWHTRI